MGKKGTKKINRKIKRSVRKTIGVLTLIMAIIVAAIPTPSARAVGGVEGDTDVTPPVYPDSEYDTRKEPITPLTPPSGTTPQKAQLIYRSSTGRYYLNNVFEYYMITDGGGNRAGCISDYNDSYVPEGGKLIIPEEVQFEYSDFTREQVLAYFTGNTHTLSDKELALYYPDEWQDYQQKKKAYDDYQLALQDWNNNTNPNKGPAPATVLEPDPLEKKIEDFLTANGGWVTQNGLRYFCSHYDGKNADDTVSGAPGLIPHITDKENGDSLEFSGYILIEVVDERNAAAGTSNKVTYMPCKVGNPDEYDENKDYSASFFTASTETNHIRYIGDKAFENAARITDLVIPKNIERIGDEAFSGCSGLRTISAYAGVIGNRAFKDCASLENVSLEDGVVTVGAECFRGCNSLRSISFPSTLAKIGFGAFAGCAALGTISMENITVNTVLADYCFFNCPSIASVTFGVNTKEIGEAAFALTEDTAIRNTSWKDITFPGSVSTLGDYVLYGRGNIETVVMPASYGSTPPEVKLGSGFFGKCIGLQYVEFPDNRTGSCGYVTFDTNAFIDVESEDFYIRGPEFDGRRNTAKPREAAWKAGITYVFKDRNNVDQYEVSTGTYRFAVDSNGVLTDCTLLNESAWDAQGNEIEVPAAVGTKIVTGIGPDCFNDEKIRGKLKVLKIADDGSIASIAERAFEGYPSLEKVYIGNSVNEIGASAFADCKKLTEVVFSPPNSGYQNFKIGTNAFSTGGDTLTFYGNIVKGYAPFDWAMSADNYMNQSRQMRVCYRSGTPEHPNLTVLYNNDNGKVTLVDYPHYDALDWSSDPDNPNGTIQQRYEKYLSGNYTDENEIALDADERTCLDRVLYIVIPEGVESIDVQGFLGSTNNANNAAAYISTSPYYRDDITGSPKKNPYYGTYRHDGLFNGYYGTYDDTYEGASCQYEYPEGHDRNEYEQNPKGNDRIQTVTMSSVTSLPERAFESCENLQAVVLGEAMEDIGTAPFTGCSRLVSVSSNSKYTGENGIIYENNDTGLTIVECLPTRGALVGAQNINAANDPKLPQVTQINEGAFENCGAVTIVDFTMAEKLTQIPRSCFRGAENLYNVLLPEAVDDIREEAFATGNKTLSVSIPAVEVDIADDAFENVSTITLRSYEDSAVENYVKRKQAKGDNIFFDPMGRKYSVQFLDYNGDVIPYVDKDGTKIYVQYVEHGGSAKRPEDPTGGPAGYVFDKWNKDFQEVTSDLVVTALYKWGYPDTSPGVLPNTSPGANRNTPTPTPNGTPTPGAGTPGAGTPGAGTPGAGTPGAGTPGASNNQNSNQRYRLTVENGSGSGTYVAGTSVVITANTPPSGQRFDRWTSIANDFNITSATSSITTITMPSHDMTIVANYTSGSGTSGGNTGNGNNNSNSTNTNINGNGNSGGTTVDITKPGISDSGVANATVEGSTDNFVVKITDTAEARAAVEAALINEYGTLDNLRYFAMDISLYDATGTVKIADTSNLAVNITMPIPDELRLYAGNNQVAGVVNGNVLDKLSPRFTTINGVPCISFTATHFSPYTVYVDTSNLSAGVSDSTPKTGDLIHPKWFLAIALACVSLILLLKKDKKQPNVKTA